MKKRMITILLAAGLVLGAAGTSRAIDFRAKGVWINMFEYGDGGNFVRQDRQGNSQQGFGLWNEDRFEAKTRVRLQLDAVASENLSGTVYFEIGAATWGRAARGGALGADGTIVKIKHAYMDWAIPGTEIRTRMGIQRIHLPDYSSEASQVLDGDMAGVTVSMPINEHVGLTAFWARPYNDNWGGNDEYAQNRLDNTDLFGVTVPLTFEGFRITPWGMVGAVGKNAFRSGSDYYGSWYGADMAPSAYRFDDGREDSNAYGTAWWAGITGEITHWDPFRLAWTFNYGSFDTGEKALNRAGWHASMLAEYRFDWGTPGIYGWYSSGDDGNIKNGSERLPAMNYNDESTSGFSGFAQLGTWTIGRDAIMGYTFAGTWGVGLRVKDVSFIDSLSHTVRVNFYRGTNDARMARYIRSGEAGINHTYGRDFNAANYDGIYLTEKDAAMEFGLMNSWQIQDNLKLLVEANYVALWLDKSDSVWGGRMGSETRGLATEDCWNVNMSFIYKF